MSAWVYMMADRYRGAIYTGMTANLAARISAHKEGRGSLFCKRYKLTRLVYVEQHERVEEAIAREKAIKKWMRAWKIKRIECDNPEWADLFERINW